MRKWDVVDQGERGNLLFSCVVSLLLLSRRLSLEDSVTSDFLSCLHEHDALLEFGVALFCLSSLIGKRRRSYEKWPDFSVTMQTSNLAV
jgi:hypothetical protein